MRLLERDDLLAALDAQQRTALDGAGRIVFVEGEAGIGKTTLLRAFASRQREHATVLWGACDALNTPRPLAPVHDIASQAPRELADVLAGDAPRREVFGAFLGMLSRHPALVLLEDLHWADEATLDLLRYIGRRIDGTRSLLLATFRSDEVGPAHPLRVVLGDLATSGALRLVPAPLSQAAVRALAGERDVDVAVLHRTTGGNPFFVTEVLAASGAGVPATVRDAVLARAARLRPSARAILDAAAVAGPRVEPWLLQDLVAAEAAHVEECLANGVLCTQGDLFMFRHELARQVVMEAMTPTQRLTLHRLVLQALCSSAAPARDPARLAHHAEAAGDERATVDFAAEAAREAAAKGAHRQAAEQWARALRQSIPTDAERAALLDAYAWECHLGGRLDDSIEARQSAIRLWRAGSEGDHEAISLAQMASTLVLAGRNAESESVMRQARERAGSGTGSAAEAITRRWSAYLRMLDRDVDEAIREASEAMAIAERLGDRESVAHCLNTLGSSMIVAGRFDEGREYLERSLELAEAMSLDSWVANAVGNLGTACGEIYRFDLAEGYLRRGIDYCIERDLDHARRYQMSWLALVQLYGGRWSESTATAHAVLADARSSAIARMMALVALGRVRARRGDPDVWEALDAARELAGRSGTLQRVAPMRAARAEAAWLEGRAEAAATEAGEGLELALRKRHAWFASELLFWKCRAEGGLAPSVPAFCDGNPFALEAQGRYLEAASGWRQRGCPYEAARALAAADEASQRAALPELEAMGARPLAERLRRDLRAAGVRGLARGPRQAKPGLPAGLTSKEADVLKLLCEGLRNKDIAQRLHRSVRTIDHHVAAIFAKLGAANRAEAVGAAHRLGLAGQPK